MRELAQEWYRAFQREVRSPRRADPLREAAMAGRLGAWTRHLTGAVIAACQAMGWRAVGRGHLAEVLPVVKQEYLALDIMAFPADCHESWPRPVAVFELENQQPEDLVAALDLLDRHGRRADAPARHDQGFIGQIVEVHDRHRPVVLDGLERHEEANGCVPSTSGPEDRASPRERREIPFVELHALLMVAAGGGARDVRFAQSGHRMRSICSTLT